MERMINARLMWSLESQGLLSEKQCGFKKNHRTLHHLVRFETFTRNAFVKTEHVLTNFFDLEKAYDTLYIHFHGVQTYVIIPGSTIATSKAQYTYNVFEHQILGGWSSSPRFWPPKLNNLVSADHRLLPTWLKILVRNKEQTWQCQGATKLCISINYLACSWRPTCLHSAYRTAASAPNSDSGENETYSSFLHIYIKRCLCEKILMWNHVCLMLCAHRSGSRW